MKKVLIPAVLVATLLLAGCSMNGKMMNSDDKMMNGDDKMMNTGDKMMNETSMNDSMKKEEGVMVGGAMMVKSKDIVDNAMMSSDHTTLVAAVKAAGLVDTLKGKGPFTVFAPTNTAFAKLPAGTVEMLVKPENKAMLTKILTYHVVAGAYMAKDLKDGMMLKSVEGEDLMITMKDGKWMVNGAMITVADVVSSNGVTFVIDTVLTPAK